MNLVFQKNLEKTSLYNIEFKMSIREVNQPPLEEKDEKDDRSAFHKLRKEHGTDVKVKVEESSEPQAITEEEFDVLAEKKDACYRKVKARYKVWPSAYASGALVQCRKVGAANWGNKSKKKKKK